jgi:hypothetical protein
VPYKFDTTPRGVPGAGYFTSDTGSLATATSLKFNDVQEFGGNAEAWLSLPDSIGAILVIFKGDAPTTFVAYRVTSSADSGGYWNYSVAVLTSNNAAAIVNGTHCWCSQAIDGEDGPTGPTGPTGPGGSGVTIDTRGAGKTVTASAASGGGTATGNIDLGVSWGEIILLRVKANGNTTDSDVAFYTDAGRTDLIYLAEDKNCFAAPYHVDAEGWDCFSMTNNLAGGLLYYTITNNGANASTYDIEMVGWGE